jgi:hypothetical protein
MLGESYVTRLSVPSERSENYQPTFAASFDDTIQSVKHIRQLTEATSADAQD